ncbi:transketolase [Mucilaginibacter achroorhodeus]|uniref:Transketolase n=1 Tax=Mucilaginibacter achroorhodeus TaxID=2599294 RepID=A0A563UAR6_9SPHI|nr:transketolase [Mucilaginibacter achroorhodeus]TWR28434.1 transketolase [Mucilaginibacter achroorhodeus]
MEKPNEKLEKLAIDTVRILSADAVQKANSGHPGTAMALAPMGHVLWTKFLNYNPHNPDFVNRDRFILSAGHACILQYSFLYLTGYDLSLDDIKQFRQLNSKTAGHPEYGLAPGVDVTTGPLGQGFANGVGFAIGQKHLAARYNKPGFDLFNYNIYSIVSDGDMMEGVTSEAASLAGHLELGNLIYLYDDNHISIEGSTDIAFNEDVSARFRAYGWHVQEVNDVNDTHALELALINAKAESQKPSLIRVRSLIAYGSPNKSGTAGSHGSPLGADEVKLVKEFFGFDPEKSFNVPDEVLKYYREKGERGVKKEEKWNELFAKYKEKYPELAAEFETAFKGDLPQGWADKLPTFKASDPKMATRQASGKVLNAIASALPNLLGGAADLAPSTETNLKEEFSFTSENRAGRNFHFGIREHAMGSALNGMSLTKGLIPFGATFLQFADYMRPPIRLAAIMKISPVFVYTHDSIGLGEDGTTHQPVEHLASLRAIPNVTVIRPADANETTYAWKVAVEKKGGPTVLVFTRQALPILDQDKFAKASNLEKGAYVVSKESGNPDLLLLATGSEVALVLQAQEKLEAEGISTRVVSMPSWELFEAQDAAYKESVLPKASRKRLAVEMASPQGWHKYTTDEGDTLCMTTFGESAPADDLYKHFGFTVDNVVAKAKALLG